MPDPFRQGLSWSSSTLLSRGRRLRDGEEGVTGSNRLLPSLRSQKLSFAREILESRLFALHTDTTLTLIYYQRHGPSGKRNGGVERNPPCLGPGLLCQPVQLRCDIHRRDMMNRACLRSGASSRPWSTTAAKGGSMYEKRAKNNAGSQPCSTSSNGVRDAEDECCSSSRLPWRSEMSEFAGNEVTHVFGRPTSVIHVRALILETQLLVVFEFGRDECHLSVAKSTRACASPSALARCQLLLLYPASVEGRPYPEPKPPTDAAQPCFIVDTNLRSCCFARVHTRPRSYPQIHQLEFAFFVDPGQLSCRTVHVRR